MTKDDDKNWPCGFWFSGRNVKWQEIMNGSLSLKRPSLADDMIDRHIVTICNNWEHGFLLCQLSNSLFPLHATHMSVTSAHPTALHQTTRQPFCSRECALVSGVRAQYIIIGSSPLAWSSNTGSRTKKSINGFYFHLFVFLLLLQAFKCCTELRIVSFFFFKNLVDCNSWIKDNWEAA